MLVAIIEIFLTRILGQREFISYFNNNHNNNGDGGAAGGISDIIITCTWRIQHSRGKTIPSNRIQANAQRQENVLENEQQNEHWTTSNGGRSFLLRPRAWNLQREFSQKDAIIVTIVLEKKKLWKKTTATQQIPQGHNVEETTFWKTANGFNSVKISRTIKLIRRSTINHGQETQIKH